MTDKKTRMPAWLAPDWPAPSSVRAMTTLRTGGVSSGPYASLNLADHVGDDPVAVAANRQRLIEAARLPAPPCWLAQVHGTRVIHADDWRPGIEADAIWSDRPGQVCAVMTADCLPVLVCDRGSSRIAAIHAGWRGLADGIIEATLEAIGGEPGELLAWLGPAIGPSSFEVGDEVRARFVTADDGSAAGATQAFSPVRPGHWLADLYQLARLRLESAGVTAISGGGWCTLREQDRFYSYRREKSTGRMATLVWSV